MQIVREEWKNEISSAYVHQLYQCIQYTCICIPIQFIQQDLHLTPILGPFVGS